MSLNQHATNVTFPANSNAILVIPAQPNTFTIYDFPEDKIVERGDLVIAWRIQTFDGTEVYSTCTAITVDGDVGANCIGVQNPDETVTVFEDSTYFSLGALQNERYPASN